MLLQELDEAFSIHALNKKADNQNAGRDNKPCALLDIGKRTLRRLAAETTSAFASSRTRYAEDKSQIDPPLICEPAFTGIVPIPSDREKLKHRGFNPAASISEARRISARHPRSLLSLVTQREQFAQPGGQQPVCRVCGRLTGTLR